MHYQEGTDFRNEKNAYELKIQEIKNVVTYYDKRGNKNLETSKRGLGMLINSESESQQNEKNQANSIGHFPQKK